MVQLLHKLSIRATESSLKLLTVVKNPVSNYLPVGSRKIFMSFNTEELIPANKLVQKEVEKPLVVVVGGIARGKITLDYTEQDVRCIALCKDHERCRRGLGSVVILVCLLLLLAVMLFPRSAYCCLLSYFVNDKERMICAVVMFMSKRCARNDENE